MTNKERREKLLSEGRCVYCKRKIPAGWNQTLCRECRDMTNARRKENRETLKRMGRCPSCGEKVEGEFKMCKSCREKAGKATERYKQKIQGGS